jgi:hypothetical protein
MTMTLFRVLGPLVGLAWLLGLAPAGPTLAAARTAEVHLVAKVDLERAHPNAPSDEPLEPTPSLHDRARDVTAAHPAFRDVTARIVTSEAPPNPRVPGDFLRLVDQRVDDVVVVDLRYHVRLDAFRAKGRAGIEGYVAVFSVAGRRKVASRQFTISVAYPGEVTKEAVIQAELAAKTRGAPVPVEEIELGLLDAAVKERLAGELSAALAVCHPASLPPLSREAVRDAMARMARHLAESPERKAEAVRMLKAYLAQYPDAPHRADLERRLQRLERGPARDPSRDRARQEERTEKHVARSLTAAELAELFEKLVGSVVEVRAFKLDWRDDGTAVMTPADKSQRFIVKGTPPRAREQDADPDPIYVLVVGREPMFLDVKVPVVRWVGCPKGACPDASP